MDSDYDEASRWGRGLDCQDKRGRGGQEGEKEENERLLGVEHELVLVYEMSIVKCDVFFSLAVRINVRWINASMRCARSAVIGPLPEGCSDYSHSLTKFFKYLKSGQPPLCLMSYLSVKPLTTKSYLPQSTPQSLICTRQIFQFSTSDQAIVPLNPA